jgi:hypothetical protein
MALDQKLMLEQGILSSASRKSKSEHGSSFEQTDAFLESSLDFAHEQFGKGDRVHGSLFEMPKSIDPNNLISAINDLQERLRQEQERVQARKFGSEVAKKTVEL